MPITNPAAVRVLINMVAARILFGEEASHHVIGAEPLSDETTKLLADSDEEAIARHPSGSQFNAELEVECRLADMRVLLEEYHKALGLASCFMVHIKNESVQEIAPELFEAQAAHMAAERLNGKPVLRVVDFAEQVTDAVCAGDFTKLIPDVFGLYNCGDLPETIALPEGLGDDDRAVVVKDLSLLFRLYDHSNRAESTEQESDSPGALVGYNAAQLWVSRAIDDLAHVTADAPFVVRDVGPTLGASPITATVPTSFAWN